MNQTGNTRRPRRRRPANAAGTKAGTSAQRRDPRLDELPEPNGAFAHLQPRLRAALRDAGYEHPTPIQEQAIEPLLQRRDLLGSAQTGTGKTAAFTLPLLQLLSDIKGRPAPGTPRALILAPTRELAAQIGESILTYGRYLRLSSTVIFGGVNQHAQVKALERGVDVLVATPGRLLDLMGQGYIYLDQVSFFVLDEMDRMLDMGFMPDIKRVVKELPSKRQTLFFSATMPKDILELAQGLLGDPVRISIEPGKPAVDRIEQRVLFVGKNDKPELLASLLADPAFSRTIVFTQMKHVANRVVSRLERSGIRASAIHGNKSQAARTKALDGFRRGVHSVLVATDVAARGIDVDQVSHVINYDLPMEAETYVHRIGRTARAGAEGIAISFCSAEERALLKEIEKLLGRQVPQDLEHRYHCEVARKSMEPAPSYDRARRNRTPRHSVTASRGRRPGRGRN